MSKIEAWIRVSQSLLNRKQIGSQLLFTRQFKFRGDLSGSNSKTNFTHQRTQTVLDYWGSAFGLVAFGFDQNEFNTRTGEKDGIHTKMKNKRINFKYLVTNDTHLTCSITSHEVKAKYPTSL